MKSDKATGQWPFTMDVATSWFTPPPSWRGRSQVGTWWFSTQPDYGKVTFRIVYIRLGKDKVRVELAYPLGPCPARMTIRTRQGLQLALHDLIQAALPDLKVSAWSHTHIDLEYPANGREEA